MAIENLELVQLDVKMDFLHDDLQDDICMMQFKSLEEPAKHVREYHF